MDLRPAEDTSILEPEIAGYKGEAAMQSVGTVLTVGDGVARVWGLDDCMMNELLEFSGGVRGVALSLEEDNVGCVLLGDATKVKEGDQVKTTGRIISVPTGPSLLGRVVNALGDPVDGRGPLAVTESDYWQIEQPSPSVVERQPVTEPMQTGLKAIDAMIPIGRGQRELVIGDRQTGKTAIALDTIINNRDSGLVSVYVAIGQRMSTVVQLAEVLAEHGALENTIIVAASADEAAPIKFMAPYAGCAMGEYFLYNGREALCIYDD